MAASEHTPSPDELLFLQLVSMFEVAAMQQLGKLPNPITKEIERDLAQAKVSIDILDLLKNKTKGNLTDKEQDFLDKVLFELHMNYVDEVKSAKDDTADAKNEGGTPDSADGEESTDTSK